MCIIVVYSSWLYTVKLYNFVHNALHCTPCTLSAECTVTVHYQLTALYTFSRLYCTQCTLSTDCTVHSVHYQLTALDTVYTISWLPCNRVHYQLTAFYTVYTISWLHCTQCTLSSAVYRYWLKLVGGHGIDC